MDKSTKLAGAILSGTSLKRNKQLRFWRKVICTGKFVKTGTELMLQVLDRGFNSQPSGLTKEYTSEHLVSGSSRESVRTVALWTFSGVIEKPGVFRTQFINGTKMETLRKMAAPKSL